MTHPDALSKQMILTNYYPKFKKLECDVYGISKDNLKSHDKFRDKYKIKFDSIS
jgi:peroxiredoxin